MSSIEYAEGVADDLQGLRKFDRTRVLDTVEEQLSEQPTIETRNKTMLPEEIL